LGNVMILKFKKKNKKGGPPFFLSFFKKKNLPPPPPPTCPPIVGNKLNARKRINGKFAPWPQRRKKRHAI